MKRLAILLAILGLLCCRAPAAFADEADVPRLIEKLIKDEKAGNRRSAALALGQLGTKAKKAVPQLISALKDVESAVRDEAEKALVKIGEPSVDELVAALKADKDEFVRLRIVNILGAIGPDAKSALPALEAAEKDDSSFVRDGAKEAVYRVQLDAKTLLAMLREKDEEKRQYAVRVLGVLSTEQAKPALAELCKVIRTDKSKTIRQDAAKSLAKFGKDKELATGDRNAIVAALTAALKDVDDTVRINAATGLGEIGPPAQSALPALQQTFRATKNEELKEALEKADMRIRGKRSGSQ